MKIFIFGLVIAFFIFKIGYWSDAYSNVVELVPMPNTNSSSEISDAECREVLNKGNIMEYPSDRDSGLWTIIYNNKEYQVMKSQLSKATGMSGQLPKMAYSCHNPQDLIISD